MEHKEDDNINQVALSNPYAIEKVWFTLKDVPSYSKTVLYYYV